MQAAKDLAWAGQHEQAVALAAQALAHRSATLAERIALHDLRVESLVALGRLAEAEKETHALGKLGTARSSSDESLVIKALALSARSEVWRRQGRQQLGLGIAREAVVAARQTADAELLARCLLRLASAQANARDGDAGVSSGREALALAQAVGDVMGQGYAHRVLAVSLTNVGQGDAARSHFEQAIALARQAGDALGLGSALLGASSDTR